MSMDDLISQYTAEGFVLIPPDQNPLRDAVDQFESRFAFPEGYESVGEGDTAEDARLHVRRLVRDVDGGIHTFPGFEWAVPIITAQSELYTSFEPRAQQIMRFQLNYYTEGSFLDEHADNESPAKRGGSLEDYQATLLIPLTTDKKNNGGVLHVGDTPYPVERGAMGLLNAGRNHRVSRLETGYRHMIVCILGPKNPMYQFDLTQPTHNL